MQAGAQRANAKSSRAATHENELSGEEQAYQQLRAARVSGAHCSAHERHHQGGGGAFGGEGLPEELQVSEGQRKSRAAEEEEKEAQPLLRACIVGKHLNEVPLLLTGNDNLFPLGKLRHTF